MDRPTAYKLWIAGDNAIDAAWNHMHDVETGPPMDGNHEGLVNALTTLLAWDAEFNHGNFDVALRQACDAVTTTTLTPTTWE